MPAHQMKVMFIGDKGVGKTTLITRKANPEPTMHMHFQRKHETINGEPISYDLFEISPPTTFHNTEPRFQKMEAQIYRAHAKAMTEHFESVNVFVICFDLTNRESFENLAQSLEMIEAYAPNSRRQYVFVANKHDQWDRKNPQHVSENHLNQLNTLLNAQSKQDSRVLLTSKTNPESIDHLFNTIAAKRFPKLLSKSEQYKNGQLQHRWVNDNGLETIQGRIQHFENEGKKLFSVGAQKKAELIKSALNEVKERAGDNYDYKNDPQIIKALAYHRHFLSRLIAFFKALKTNSIKELENNQTESKDHRII